MSEKLISANDLLRFVKDWGKLIGRAETADSFIYAINKAPAVDAVAVVRCKDCKYAMLLRKPEGKLIADCWIRKMNSEDEQFCMVSGDDFCSWGERREEECG